MGAIKVLRGVIGVILCLVLGVSVWLTVERQVFHHSEVALGQVTLRPVADDAMAPVLHQGDLALTMATGNYQMGDAVLCGDGEFRRLVGTVEDSFIARGDGEGEEAETLLTAQDVKGEVLASLPGAGLVMDYLSAPWGAPSVLVVGILLVVLPSLLGLGRRPSGRKPSGRRPSGRKPSGRKPSAPQPEAREAAGQSPVERTGKVAGSPAAQPGAAQPRQAPVSSVEKTGASVPPSSSPVAPVKRPPQRRAKEKAGKYQPRH